MTNEENAREMGEFFDSTYLAALEMAEWKDQQFKEYLEETFKRLDGYANDCIREGDCTSAALYIARTDTIRMIINELFPEQEQDNSNNDE